MKTKKCLKCLKELSVDDFHKDKSKKTGLREQCKSCRCKFKSGNIEKKCIACQESFIIKNNYAKAQKYCSIDCQYVHIKYGVCQYKHEDLLISSNYKCSICGKEETNIDKRTNKTYTLSIDHCHKTNKVRGVLCSNCNTGLGSFKDNISNLNKAIEYLKNTI
jgi:hypothetical protein